MPIPGLSLVGFLDQAQALGHFRNDCIVANASDVALIQEWQTARAQLGQPIANAGYPNITPIPQADAAHIVQLSAPTSWAYMWLQNLGAHTFQLVEIDPLLAYQFTVDTARSAHHCQGLNNPTVAQMLPVCLPLVPPSDNFETFRTPESVMLKSKSLNVVGLNWGFLDVKLPNGQQVGHYLGMQIGMSLALMHVVRYNERCYLLNGFHRALGMRAAGATHIPCLFRDVNDPAAANLREDGRTFTKARLEAPDPPTLGHFTQGRAYNVILKTKVRVLHVSWSDYVLPIE